MEKDKILSRLVYKGHNRYEESHGLWYEDFIPGEIYMHKPGRTVTEIDNIWQSLINLNNHPLHIDNDYASETEFGKPLVSSLVTFGIVGGLSLAGTSARGIANLGWDKVRFTHPVFVGDTIYAETEVISKRPSASRPGQGIVTVETRGMVKRGVVFMTAIRSFLIPLYNTSTDPE